MAASRFGNLQPAPPIEVFSTNAKFGNDTYSNKVNLSLGAYKTNEGKPWVLPVVKAAEHQIANDVSLNHEYLPVTGLPAFTEAVTELLLGQASTAISENRVVSTQALGGTGALRLGAEFCRIHLGMTNALVSDPTWGNHIGVLTNSGYQNVSKYRYWNEVERSVDVDGMCEDIAKASPSTLVILHGCAHNPTGLDPTAEQWPKIVQAFKTSGAFPLIDIAYQGFSSGDLDADASSARLFEKEGFEFFVAQSFSKNFGLYNERVGNLCMVLSSSSIKSAVKSQMELLIRRMWSNPPNHGARIVATILRNPSFCAEWKDSVRQMAERIFLMRKMLYENLKLLGTPGRWNHIIEQTGMFSYTGLNESQVAFLQSKYHIYMLKSGRINMCGLTTNNMTYVAEAIHDAVLSVTQ